MDISLESPGLAHPALSLSLCASRPSAFGAGRPPSDEKACPLRQLHHQLCICRPSNMPRFRPPATLTAVTGYSSSSPLFFGRPIFASRPLRSPYASFPTRPLPQCYPGRRCATGKPCRAATSPAPRCCLLTRPRCRLDNVGPKTVSPRLPDPGAGRGKTFDLSLRAVAGEPQVTTRTAAAEPVR